MLQRSGPWRREGPHRNFNGNLRRHRASRDVVLLFRSLNRVTYHLLMSGDYSHQGIGPLPRSSMIVHRYDALQSTLRCGRTAVSFKLVVANPPSYVHPRHRSSHIQQGR